MLDSDRTGELDDTLPPGATREYFRAHPIPERPGGRGALQWAINIAVAALVFAGVILLRRPDRDLMERGARRELQGQLEPGEAVRALATVSQRRWWDLFPTYGAVAATDRRLLFVGRVPTLVATPGSPPPFEVRSLAYDTSLHVQLTDPLAGRHSMTAEQEEARLSLHAAGGEGERLRAVATSAGGTVQALARYLFLDQWYRDSVEALPPVETRHRVRRGDALLSIAALYGTPPEQIVQWNRMRDSTVRIGQELIVRVTPRQAGTCPERLCGRFPLPQPVVTPPAPSAP